MSFIESIEEIYTAPVCSLIQIFQKLPNTQKNANGIVLPHNEYWIGRV
jgi:hypothetical protein